MARAAAVAYVCAGARPMTLPVQQRLLVADDDTNIAELVQLYLAKQGYECDLAFDGTQVQALLKDREYDLAVLDVMMPGANGIQIVRNLRRYSDLPVIFLTAAAQTSTRSPGCSSAPMTT